MADSKNEERKAVEPKATSPKAGTKTTSKAPRNSPNEKYYKQEQENQKHRKFVRKLPPRAPESNRHNIYINRKTNFKAQLKRCETLLKGTELKEVYLHCLGFAITTGLNLALQLIKRHSDTLDYAINTSTIQLIDEHHPLNDSDDVVVRQRNNAATHIKIFKKNTVPVGTAIGKAPANIYKQNGSQQQSNQQRNQQNQQQQNNQQRNQQHQQQQNNQQRNQQHQQQQRNSNNRKQQQQ